MLATKFTWPNKIQMQNISCSQYTEYSQNASIKLKDGPIPMIKPLQPASPVIFLCHNPSCSKRYTTKMHTFASRSLEITLLLNYGNAVAKTCHKKAFYIMTDLDLGSRLTYPTRKYGIAFYIHYPSSFEIKSSNTWLVAKIFQRDCGKTVAKTCHKKAL